MAADDPNEKSLYCRIKDCVLAELDRSKNEVKRSKCPSRSTWVWNLGKNDEPAEKAESQKVESEKAESQKVESQKAESQKVESEKVEKEPPKREITRSFENKNSKSTSENKDERLRGGHGHVEGKSEKKETILEHSEHNGEHENIEEGRKKEETNSSESEKHKERHTSSAEKQDEKHEGNKNTVDQQNSCDSKKFKPVRYYIKMQDPEAPPCCSTQRLRKMCPPKTRKYQQETSSYCPSRPTCKCEGCVAEFYENRYSKN